MSPEILRLLILIAVFGSVMLLAETVISSIRASRGTTRAVNKRLSLIAKGFSGNEVLSVLRRSRQESARFPGPLGNFARRVETNLSSAGLTMSPSRLFLYLCLATVGIFVLALALVYMSGGLINLGKILLVGAFAVALGMGVPLLVVSRLASRRRTKLIQQFPVALDIFVRGLRAGHPVSAAIDLLTTEMSDPIGTEFGIVADEVTYGAELRDALQDMADRCGIEDMQMFVVSLSIQTETGGNLAEILENLSQVIRERASMLMKVRALSSEGRMTALILTALPVVSFVVLFMTNPAFYLDVAEDPAFVIGFLGLLLGFGIGVFWIRKLVDLKV